MENLLENLLLKNPNFKRKIINTLSLFPISSMQRTQQVPQKSPVYSQIPSSKQASHVSPSENKRNNIILATLFVTFLLGFVALYLNMPAISS